MSKTIRYDVRIEKDTVIVRAYGSESSHIMPLRVLAEHIVETSQIAKDDGYEIDWRIRVV